LITLALLAAVTFDAAAIAQTSATLNALGPHPFGSPRNRAAAQFVAAKLQEAGLAQTVVEEFTFEGATGTNVVASLQGKSDRLLIIATHHDSRKEAQDVSDRSRSLSLLIEIGRQASRLRPERTWILASFDGGESLGEGFAHYLSSLGKSRGLVDGVVILDASPLHDSASAPSLIAPACASGTSSAQRGMAEREMVAAAVQGVPASLDFSFDDPSINLITQPFIRSFRTECDPMAARALAQQIGVLLATDTSYSRAFMAGQSAPKTADPAMRDQGAVRLGEVAFAAIQGIDTSFPTSPGSDSWLVVGQSVWPGWLIFLLGMGTLIPGVITLRNEGPRLWMRVAFSTVLTVVLYFEPETALFAFALPNLLPPSSPRKYLHLAFLPFSLLLLAGGLGLARGVVSGSWLSVWVWAGLGLAVLLLYVSPASGKKAAPRPKRGKR
jgi:hypothetical protein